MNFQELNQKMAQLDQNSMADALNHWNDLAKPIGSLGLLEKAVIKIAGLTKDENVRLDKRALFVLCADNGVVKEGITQADSEITAVVAEIIAYGKSAVCRMAHAAKTDVIPIDMGMLRKLNAAKMIDSRIAPGTGNIATGPAMTREDALKAIETGISLVQKYQKAGYQIFCTGEMGIGNTTTSSAIAAVLLNKSAAEVTGRGAGMSDEELQRKVEVIERAVKVNCPDPNDVLDVLAKLGGFDIAAMTGIFLGGALYRVPVVVDGFISAVSALVASRLCPASVSAMLASHISAEPAARMVLDAIGLDPLICAEMRLGEGTGAIAALPLLDMALAVYHEMARFSEIGMDTYTPDGGYRCEQS